MAHHALYAPLQMGAVEISNRIILAPLTRNRATPDGVPGPWAKEYYTQRASGGLLITEATQITPMGKGYLNTPGIHSAEQIAAWREITDSVHAAGGKIALQLWHVGRISHSSLLPDGAQPVAPSALQAKSQVFNETGFVDTDMPRALETSEIPDVINHYVQAARNARDAGFDLVEIHAANGYLIDQFLRDGSNQRTDDYGGSVENRVRLLRDVTSAVSRAIGSDRIGVRLSPAGTFNDMVDSDPKTTFVAAANALNALDLAYLHVVEDFATQNPLPDTAEILEAVRQTWGGTFIANGGYDGAKADQAVTTGHADAIAFGVPYLANPDLPERIKRDAPLNTPDQSTFYGGDATGYTDYPVFESA